jgi:hypothetical protein
MSIGAAIVIVGVLTLFVLGPSWFRKTVLALATPKWGQPAVGLHRLLCRRLSRRYGDGRLASDLLSAQCVGNFPAAAPADR